MCKVKRLHVVRRLLYLPLKEQKITAVGQFRIAASLIWVLMV